MSVSSLRSVFLRAALALALFAPFGGAARAVTFVVTSAADTAGTTCSTTCTLRQAIGAANLTAAADTINFAIPTPIKTEILIAPATVLPTITKPLTINGYSENLSAVNTSATSSNAKIRIRVDGAAIGANGRGFSICATNVIIKGLSITGFTSDAVDYGNDNAGTACATPPTGGVIAGNFIGLRSDGTTAAGNGTGVAAKGALTIGGSSAADRNVIAASTSSSGGGVFLNGAVASGCTITNNLIGTDRSGTLDRGNVGPGINLISTASDATIGTISAPNLFAYNGLGIRVVGGAFTNSNTLYANRFHDNDGLGIDLNDDGVTENDANDADTGTNALQNFPSITAASRTQTGLSVSGSLDIGGLFAQLRTYKIALYASASCDGSGNGEGERFLGAVDKTLNVDAIETFSISLATSDPLSPGTVITATATDSGGNTSEFSDCFALDPPPLVVTKVADTNDGACNADCSLREAITVLNTRAAGSQSVINFNIAGSGPFTIAPTSALPTISNTVLIDGYSETGASPNSLVDGDDASILIRIDGTSAGASSPALAICAGNSEIRGLSITHFFGGVTIGLDKTGTLCASHPSGVKLVGNFIGLRPDGTADGISTTDVADFGDNGTTIGGAATADRNVISASSIGNGVSFLGSATDRRIDNNYIGTDPSGVSDRGNSGAGIGVQSSGSNVAVGLLAPNRIAFNAIGIQVGSGAGTGNTLYSNRILSNDGLGIDLGTSGVDTNDADDADSGPNNRQNFPELSGVQRSNAGVKVAGTLDVPVGTSNAAYIIGVYANSACDPSGNGEGERFLGTKVVNLSQTSGESFVFDLATDDPLGAGTQITTTATDPNGNTSEFSACIAATDPPPGFVVNSNADTNDGNCTASAGGCTLREAINAANLQVGADFISFDIPGTGPFTIALGSALPAIAEAVTIDGYTQIGAAPNTLLDGDDAVLLIGIDAIGQTGSDASFRVAANSVTLRGLSVVGAPVEPIRISLGADGTRIEGCFIGLQPDGSTTGFNIGSLVDTGTHTVVGGAEAAARNLLSDSQAGVNLNGTGARVDNNYIGTDRTGLLHRGNTQGVGSFVTSAAADNVIGSVASNRIAFNGTGVRVGSTTAGVTVQGNEIFANDALGIDLAASGSGPDGFTANDVNDADTGANNLQNFPVLASALAEAASLTVNGTLDVPAATANAPYTIALYENTACDGSGNGEGEIFLGSAVKNLSGNAESFSVTLAVTPPEAGHAITATATDPNGNTSEFSACFTAPPINTVFSDSYESP